MATEIPQIIRTAADLVPALRSIPALGRTVIFLNRIPRDDTKALEELRRAGDKKKKEREKEARDNGRYVLKVSEAIKCVDAHAYDPRIILDFVRAVGSTLIGGTTSGFDPMRNRIVQCLKEKALRQDTPRVFRDEPGYQRPRKGHGHGRKTFGPPDYDAIMQRNRDRQE